MKFFVRKNKGQTKVLAELDLGKEIEDRLNKALTTSDIDKMITAIVDRLKDLISWDLGKKLQVSFTIEDEEKVKNAIAKEDLIQAATDRLKKDFHVSYEIEQSIRKEIEDEIQRRRSEIIQAIDLKKFGDVILAQSYAKLAESFWGRR